jgi:predicted nuclease of predicted toxin-antitoxin system
MSVALYVDEHVHRAITAGLRLRDVDVLTAQENGRRNTPDAILLDRATELQRVMFSQDEDLLAEAKRRQTEGVPFAGVIYAHQLRVTIGVCVRDLELIAKAADPEDLANRVEYLPL